MMSETIIPAIVYSLFTGVWQAALVWLLFQLVQFRFPLAAKNTYWLLLTIICVLFVAGVANFFYFIHHPTPPTLPLVSETNDVLNISLPNTLYSIIVLLYCLGCLYHGFRLVTSFYHLSFLAKNQLPLPAAALSMVKELQSKHPSLRKVSLAAAADVNSPLTFGWIKPLILFPVAALNRLSMEEMQSIILHEMAHIRRNDFLHECLISTIEIGMFYNPFARLLINQLREEREKACDDEVIESGIPVYAYAKALLVFAQKDFGKQSVPAMAFSGNQPKLLNRIKRLATAEQEKKSIPLFSTGLSVMVLIAGLVWMNSNVTISRFISNTKTVATVADANSKKYSQVAQTLKVKTAVIVASQTDLPSVVKKKLLLPAQVSNGLNKIQNPGNPEQLQESPNNKKALPVLSVANQSYSGLAKLELLQRNWDALPDSLCNAFTTNAIAQLSPEDRFIWVQTLQKLYSVYPNNETYLASVNRHAPFIVFFNTQVSSALSGIALQCLTSIREQMEAYYLQNHIMIQSSIPKDSTRIGSRAAAIQ